MRLNYIDNVDCLEGIAEIPDKSVDLIVTDPPYFLSMGHAGCSDNAHGHQQLKSNRAFNDLAICAPFYKELFREFARVLKDTGSFYWFTDWRGYAFYFPLLNQFLPVRNMLVWDKGGAPGSYYTFSHELVVYGTNLPKLPHPGGANIIHGIRSFSSGAKKTNGPKVHPTQKPVELIEKFIEDSTEPGAVVLDTFSGSGTTAVACLRTGRNYIGFELDEQYHAIALQRIAETLAQLDQQATEEGPGLKLAAGLLYTPDGKTYLDLEKGAIVRPAEDANETEEDWMA